MNMKKTLDFIQNKLPKSPQSAVIIGSGLGGFISQLRDTIHIPYADIPNFPESSVSGHVGEWVFGYINEKPIICANGRFHYYEGFSLDQVTLTVSISHGLGCSNLFITNAAGCLVQEWNLGDLMLIQGYLDYTFIKNSNSPSIVHLEQDSTFLSKLKKIALENDINLREGIYTWTLGPTYETSAEIDDIISLGGTAVGMSTAPELMKAQELKLNVIGISCLTNYGSGLQDETLTHEAVLETSSKIQNKFSEFMKRII